MENSKKVTKEQIAEVIDKCMEAWDKLNRIEVRIEKLNNHIDSLITGCKTDIEGITTTLFFDEDESEKEEK